jgi:hypothetical protein
MVRYCVTAHNQSLMRNTDDPADVAFKVGREEKKGERVERWTTHLRHQHPTLVRQVEPTACYQHEALALMGLRWCSTGVSQ